MNSEERERRANERYGERKGPASPKQKVRDRLLSGAALAVLAVIFLNSDLSVVGVIAGAAAAYYFVVAAISMGIHEGRSSD